MITASTLHAPLQGTENEGNEIHLKKDTRRKKYKQQVLHTLGQKRRHHKTEQDTQVVCCASAQVE